MYLQLYEWPSRNQELAARVDSDQARHLRALRALRAAEADKAPARRGWRALLLALSAR
jgi:hypothetical protein